MAHVVNLSESSLFDSPSLFKEMAVLKPNAIAKTQAAMQFIHDNKIPGVLIGGMAVSHYTHDRPLTPDVDFLTSNLNGLMDLLKKKIHHDSFRPLAPSKDYNGIYVPSLDADFLDASGGNAGLNSYIIKTATTAKIGGATFPIIDPAVLMIMKFSIGRDKDQTDAFKLIPTLSKSATKTHLQAMKNIHPSVYEDTDAATIWSYVKAMSKNP